MSILAALHHSLLSTLSSVRRFVQTWSRADVPADTSLTHDFGGSVGVQKAVPYDECGTVVGLGNVDMATKAAYVHEDECGTVVGLGDVGIATKAACVHEDECGTNVGLAGVDVAIKSAYDRNDSCGVVCGLGDIEITEGGEAIPVVSK